MLEKMRLINQEDRTSNEPLVRELGNRKSEVGEIKDQSETHETDDLKPKLNEVFAVGCNGEVIKGTVTSIAETDLGMTIELEDITEPEAYRNRHGTFTYTTLSGRWEATKE